MASLALLFIPSTAPLESSLRAVLENVLSEKVGHQPNFKKTLAEAEAKSFLSEADRVTLYAVFDMGSATQHRAYLPSNEDLDAVLDIVESLVKRLFVHDHVANELRSRTPERPNMRRSKMQDDGS